MTNEERIRSLQDSGYSRREAEFLCLAALHSGYFLRRQYSYFLPQVPGSSGDPLVRKILTMEHATEQSAGRRTLLYHLCSRDFYDTIGESDNRHRRRRAPFAIKAKLMALDFVLANPGNRYLATEEEKTAYFTGELGFQKQVLPAKIYRSADGQPVTYRYFVDKSPIFIARDDNSHPPPVASFCYVDEGGISTPGFETYLHQYAQLFHSLGRFRIVYVGTQERSFHSATKILDSFLRQANGAGVHPDSGQLIEYLELEDLYRARRFDRLYVTKLERLRILRKQFPADRYADLFDAWKQGGKATVNHILNAREPVPLALQCDLKTYVLHYDYDIFGYPERSKNRPGRSK